jgi:hypothetical protein
LACMEELQLVTKQVFTLIVAVVGCILVTTDLLRRTNHASICAHGRAWFVLRNGTFKPTKVKRWCYIWSSLDS